MTKTAIIVGMSSMLGRCLSERLTGFGYELLSCGRSSESDIYLDLNEDEPISVIAGVKADILFHCAASFEGDDMWGAWKNEKINALACLNIAALANCTGCKQVIYASSISCYPNPTTGDISSYGGSKSRGESILNWALRRAGILFCSLRFPQLYDDKGDSFKHQPWLRRIIAYAYAGQVLNLPPTPHKQNFLYVEDAVDLMCASAEKKLSGLWPVAHPVSDSYLLIAKMAYELFSNGGGVIEAKSKRPFNEQYIPDSEDLFERLGCRPAVSMNEGLKRLKERCEISRFGAFDVE